MRWRLGFFCMFLFCAGGVAFALYHQFFNWIMPCLMCVYERMVFIGVGLLALLFTLFAPRGRVGVALATGSVSIVSLLGVGVASRHLLMQYGPPDPTASCAASLPFPINLNDPFWPQWLGALIRPVGDCSQVDFVLFGVSMPVWALLSYLGFFVAAVYLGCWRWRVVSVRRFWK